MKQYKCSECKQTELFIAPFRLYGECVVNPNLGNGTGSVIAGIDSPCNLEVSKHCDSSMSTEVDAPTKCAVCGSKNIMIKNGRKFVAI